MGKKFLALLLGLFLNLPSSFAHCPLCTLGAAAAAGTAAYFGVHFITIGLFIGAFAASMGWWLSNIVKKQFIPQQRAVFVILSFIATIFPILPLFKDTYPLYISLYGSYGSLLNRTYLLNTFFIGSLIGAFIMSVTPFLSSKITKVRGKSIPFQGMILTAALLVVLGLIFQFLHK